MNTWEKVCGNVSVIAVMIQLFMVDALKADAQKAVAVFAHQELICMVRNLVN